MTYQEQKMQILTRLIADVDDAMEHMGTPFNTNPSAKVQKRLDDASTALDELVQKMIIGEDEFALPGPGYVRNEFRASQRQVLEEGK